MPRDKQRQNSNSSYRSHRNRSRSHSQQHHSRHQKQRSNSRERKRSRQNQYKDKQRQRQRQRQRDSQYNRDRDYDNKDRGYYSGSSHHSHNHRQYSSSSTYDYYETRTHSKRRSQSNQSQQHYQGKDIQKLQQKIRLAIRTHTLEYDQQTYQAFTSLPQRKQQQLTAQAHSPQKIHQCVLVRQLFVSGLNQINEYTINQLMGKYGQIQNIQIIKDFAFIKYFRVQDASNACADYHNINASIQPLITSNFKIFFADHLKRWNVVSNHIDYQIREHLLPVVYVSVKNDPQYANQKYLRSVFSKYGFIRNIQIRKNQLPGPKIYVNVQYQTLQQALRARNKLKNQRQKFGEKKSQLAILIDSQKITKVFPNVMNQIRYQKKRLQNMGVPIMPSGGSYSNLGSLQSYQPSTHMINPMMSLNSQHSQAPPSNNFQTEDIFAMLDKLNEKKSQNQFTPLQNLMESQSDWAGFFTRNKQFKVQVDFNRIHKDVNFELQSILNVSHRGDIYQALNRTDYILAGKFKAANNLNAKDFHEYISYFNKKNKAGILFTQLYVIYLIPPKEQLNLPYQINQNQMLALFFKIPN